MEAANEMFLKIDGSFDQTQAQHFGVEFEIFIG
jgi:hypothetical protein